MGGKKPNQKASLSVVRHWPCRWSSSLLLPLLPIPSPSPGTWWGVGAQREHLAWAHSRCGKPTILAFTLKKQNRFLLLFSKGDGPASRRCRVFWTCPFETEWASRREVGVPTALHPPLHLPKPRQLEELSYGWEKRAPGRGCWRRRVGRAQADKEGRTASRTSRALGCAPWSPKRGCKEGLLVFSAPPMEPCALRYSRNIALKAENKIVNLKRKHLYWNYQNIFLKMIQYMCFCIKSATRLYNRLDNQGALGVVVREQNVKASATITTWHEENRFVPICTGNQLPDDEHIFGVFPYIYNKRKCSISVRG